MHMMRWHFIWFSFEKIIYDSQTVWTMHENTTLRREHTNTDYFAIQKSLALKWMANKAKGTQNENRAICGWNENWEETEKFSVAWKRWDNFIRLWYKVFTTHRHIHRSSRLFGCHTHSLQIHRYIMQSMQKTHTHKIVHEAKEWVRVFKHALMQANVRVNINVNNMRIEEESFTRFLLL